MDSIITGIAYFILITASAAVAFAAIYNIYMEDTKDNG